MRDRKRSVFIKRLLVGTGAAALAIVPVVGWRVQSAHAAGTPAFVQQNYATPTSGSSVKVTLSAAEAVGDTNVVAIGFANKTSTIASVTDSKGNLYQVAVPLVRDTAQSQAIYYAKNIAAGSNTLTVTFNNSVSYPDVRLAEYANLDTSAPFVAGTSAAGTTTAANSGSAIATGAGIVFGAGNTTVAFSSAGTGFTKRVITSDDDIAEDKIITAGGSYNATATMNKTGKWVMQVAIFKAAVTAPADTVAPSVPAGLTATATSIAQINLSWGAATDNTGVVGYRLYQNGVKVADTASLAYADTGLSVNTAYGYTVSAYDAAGNESAKSVAVAASTLADTTAPSVPATVTATAVSGSVVNVSWAASTDNVGVASYDVYLGGVKTGNFAGTSAQLSGLTFGTTYTVTVSALDAAGNESAQSAAATVTTPAPDTTAPTVPTGLTATAATTAQINLQWSASTDDTAVAGYTVYRDGVQIGTTTIPTYSDTQLSAATLYGYSVSAYDASGNQSTQSDLVSAQTLTPDVTAPSVPTGLTATIVSANEIDLSWTPSADDRAMGTYTVYQNGAALGTVATNSYAATGLTASTTYSFTVSATDAVGNASAASGAAQATTQAAAVVISTSCPLPAYPTPSCTGVSASTALTVHSGDYAVTTPNAVIDGWHLTGDLDIKAAGVVIKNSQIDGTVSNDNVANTSFTISDSTVGTATCNTVGTPSLYGHDIIATRVYLHGHQDGVDVGGDNVNISDSYLQPCFLPLGSDGFHTDGMQDICGNVCSNVTLTHNTLDARGIYNGKSMGNSALNFGSSADGSHLRNVTLANNMFMGGGYTTDLRYTAGTNWTITGNTWVNGTWTYDSVSTEATCKNQTWSGNSIVTIDANYAVFGKVSDLACKE